MALNSVRQKGLVTRYTHVKYEGTYQSKDIVNVKVFEDKHTEKWMDQKLCAPDLSMRGHKKSSRIIVLVQSPST